MSESPHANQRALYGGQAVIEGIMIRGRTAAALAVRKPDGAIGLHSLPLETWANGRSRRVPAARGVLVLLETLILGAKALSLSAAEASKTDSQESGKEPDGAISDAAMASMMVIGLGLGIALFLVVPLLISRAVESSGSLIANLTEGAVRLVIFLGYIWAIGRMKDIQRVFGYHGAEHMAVWAHENGQPLTAESLRKYPTAHPRCGTSFLLTVVLVSIIVFIFVPREPFWFVLSSRIVLIPLIAAASYELIRFAGLHLSNPIVRALTSPNLLLQSMTTRQPDDRMIEVAIAAMGHALELDGRSAQRAAPAPPATSLPQ
jgi:uncharacterized protein YqhQ